MFNIGHRACICMLGNCRQSLALLYLCLWYPNFYISGKMEMNLMVCRYIDMKKKGILRIVWFIVELFADVKLFFGLIYTYIYDHHVVPQAWISLTLSRHFSLSFIASGRSSGPHPISSHSCWMYVRAGRPAFARPYVGVHRSTSLMSSSLLLQQCPAFYW